jgi:hypothetical protein
MNTNLIFKPAIDHDSLNQFYQIRNFSYGNDSAMRGLLSQGKKDLYDSCQNSHTILAIDTNNNQLIVGGLRISLPDTSSQCYELPFENEIVNRKKLSKIFNLDFGNSFEYNKLVFYPTHRNIKNLQNIFLESLNFLKAKSTNYGFIVTTTNKPRERMFRTFLKKHAQIISLSNIIFPNNPGKYEGQEYTILIVDIHNKININDYEFLTSKNKVRFEDLL